MLGLGAPNPSRRRIAVAVVVSFLVLAAIVSLGLVAYYWPTTEEQASIDVISVPEGASVTLNGAALQKTTPLTIPIKDRGTPQTLEIRMTNYQPWRSTIRFPEGTTRVRALAVLTAIYGRLELASQPPGAEVYVNGEHKGQTPTVLENLSLGEDVSLELRKRGYRPLTAQLSWNGRTFLKQTFPLKRSR